MDSILSAWDWHEMIGHGGSAKPRPVGGFGFVANSILPNWVLYRIGSILSAGFTICSGIANRILPGKALYWLCDHGRGLISGSWLRIAITFYILGLLSRPAWTRFKRRAYSSGGKYKAKLKLQLQKLRNTVRRNPASKLMGFKPKSLVGMSASRSGPPGRYHGRSDPQGRRCPQEQRSRGGFTLMFRSRRLYVLFGAALVGLYLLWLWSIRFWTV